MSAIVTTEGVTTTATTPSGPTTAHVGQASCCSRTDILVEVSAVSLSLISYIHRLTMRVRLLTGQFVRITQYCGFQNYVRVRWCFIEIV